MHTFQPGDRVRVTKSPYLSLPHGTAGYVIETLPWDPWANDGLIRVSFHGTTTRWAMLASWLERINACTICHGEGMLEDEYDDDAGHSVACYANCPACGGSGDAG